MKTAEEKKPENSLRKTNLQTDQYNAGKVREKTAIEPPTDNDQLEPAVENSSNKGQGPAGENL